MSAMTVDQIAELAKKELEAAEAGVLYAKQQLQEGGFALIGEVEGDAGMSFIRSCVSPHSPTRSTEYYSRAFSHAPPLPHHRAFVPSANENSRGTANTRQRSIRRCRPTAERVVERHVPSPHQI